MILTRARRRGWMRAVVVVALLSLAISCDQISKKVVRKKISYLDEIAVVPDHVTLTNIENTGSMLSVGESLPRPYKFILLTLVPVLILTAGTAVLLAKQTINGVNVLGFSLALGGGIGNIYDRLMHGSVTDFIHLRFGILETGIFNFADVSIFAGIFILLIHSYIRQARIGQRS